MLYEIVYVLNSKTYTCTYSDLDDFLDKLMDLWRTFNFDTFEFIDFYTKLKKED